MRWKKERGWETKCGEGIMGETGCGEGIVGETRWGEGIVGETRWGEGVVGETAQRERQSGRVNLPRCLPGLILPYTPSPSLRSSLWAPGTKIQTAVTLDWFATVIRWNPLLTPL